MTITPHGPKACAAVSAVCAALAGLASPASASAASEPSKEATHSADESKRDRRLMIVGASVAAAGVSLGVASLGVVVGMHAGNPGKGREFEGFSDDEAQRVVTTARVFEGLAYSGAALAVSGAIVLTVAALRHRRQRRSVRNAQFAPTRNGVIFSMRF